MVCMRIESNRIKLNWLSIEACISAKLQVFRLAYNPIKVKSFVVFMSVCIFLLQQFAAKTIRFTWTFAVTEKRFKIFFLSPIPAKHRFCYNFFFQPWFRFYGCSSSSSTSSTFIRLLFLLCELSLLLDRRHEKMCVREREIEGDGGGGGDDGGRQENKD